MLKCHTSSTQLMLLSLNYLTDVSIKISGLIIYAVNTKEDTEFRIHKRYIGLIAQSLWV